VNVRRLIRPCSTPARAGSATAPTQLDRPLHSPCPIFPAFFAGKVGEQQARLFYRLNHRTGLVLVLLLFAPLLAAAQTPPGTSQPAAAPVVLDRVVAVVNNSAILASDVDEEVRLSVLDPGQAGHGLLTRPRALQQLIARTLIQQQIRQEDERAAAPAKAEIDQRLAEIRNQMPSCVHRNCASEAGWKAFLADHDLTPERVETYLRNRVEILRFIELRFRQGIRISPQEIESYYRETLLPLYTTGESAPPLDQVSDRIEEILLQQQVNILFDDWLANLRKQGEIEVFDPTLETAATEKGGKP